MRVHVLSGDVPPSVVGKARYLMENGYPGGTNKMRPNCYMNFKGIIIPKDDERGDCDECNYQYWCEKETIKLHDKMKAETK